jgi:hypothetical protein
MCEDQRWEDDGGSCNGFYVVPRPHDTDYIREIENRYYGLRRLILGIDVDLETLRSTNHNGRNKGYIRQLEAARSKYVEEFNALPPIES